MKKLVALFMALTLLLSVCVGASADSLCPYEGDEVVYAGYGADLTISENRETEVYRNYRTLTGNVSINWSTAPWADYDTKMATMLNTGDLPDIAWFRDAPKVIANYGDLGYFLNFMDYLDYMPNLSQYLKDYPQYEYFKTEGGALYCVVDLQTIDRVSEGFFYNKTQLDALGLEVPVTWDEMLTAMRALKAAKPESTPLITYAWGLGIYQSYLSMINQSHRGFYYDGEKWTWAISDPNSGFKELVGMLNTLYTEGLISPEFSTMSEDQYKQIVMDGDWLFAPLYLGTIRNEIFMGDEPTYEYDWLPTPVMTADQKPMLPITVGYDALNYWGFFVNANVENPELMCSYVDTIISPEAGMAWMWGKQGLTYDFDENGSPYFLEGYTTVEQRSEAGIANFMDPRYIHNGGDLYQLYLSYPEQDQLIMDRMMEGLVSGAYTYQYPLRRTPLFTAAENETIGFSTTPMNTYADENIIQFIDGTRDMGEWDNFVAEVLEYGNLEEVLETYENAKQIIFSTERRFVTYK
ncbi:MAG: extracellular solute-binding protein [Christensenellales bacterium]|jgi:putative aldouronate transport system substrate-binding protein